MLIKVALNSYLHLSTGGEFSSATTGFGHDRAAEWLISWSAGKYLPYDICIRLFA
jgi:hypothetical protein